MKLSKLNKLKGGRGDNVDVTKIDQKQLIDGTIVELEHTGDINIAIEIAIDHISEDPKYYDKLKKIEKHEHEDEGILSKVTDEIKRLQLQREPKDGLKPIENRGPGD